MTSTRKPKKPTGSTVNPQLPAITGEGFGIAPALCPGAHPTAEDLVGQFASAITDNWNKSIEAILIVARRCAEAKKTLDVLERGKLYRRLPFAREMFSKLATLGGNEALFTEKVRKHLPANWTIIYLLRHLTEQEIQQAISVKALTADSTRNDLGRWLSENSSRRREDRSRAAHNDAHHEDLVRSLLGVWHASSEMVELWRRSPDAVRTEFFQRIKST